MKYIQGSAFSAKDTKPTELILGEYEDCDFSGLDFSEFDFSDYKFSNCNFNDCDLSNVKISGTALRTVTFYNCKMIGLSFDDVNAFNLSLQFEKCILDHSSFYQVDVRKTLFRDCTLRETDFTLCNLASAVFTDSDLLNAVFSRTNLEAADLRTARNFSINPNKNTLKKAKFSKDNLEGLLYQVLIIIT